MTNSTRLLMAASCAAILVVLGLSMLKQREAPAASPQQSAQVPVLAETKQTQTPDGIVEKTAPSVGEPAGVSAIPAFRQWAETAAASGFAQTDQNRGMELAKARAADMKALIRKDPAAALREALPADLRASLPPQIAAAIEQPVKTSGMVSMRMTCSHSSDESHGNCEATPVLLEDVISWNAYYDEQKWRAHLGQTVQLDGIAVDEELAVRNVTPAPE